MRPEFLTAPSTPPWPQIKPSLPDSRRASSPARLRRRIPPPACRRSPSPPCPTANSTRPTSWSGARRRASVRTDTSSLRAQYVGTRAVNQPYLTQVNGYQTVCDGCFAPFPYLQPTDPRFGAVTQFSTGANSHYNGLQLTAKKRLGHGLRARSTTPSAAAWTRFPTAASCNSPPAASSRRCPASSSRDYGPCDYDIRHNLTAQYVYQLPIKATSRALGMRSTAGRFPAPSSGTAEFHSPFSARPTQPTGTASCRAADRNSPASFPACPSTPTSPFPASPSPVPCSGSIPTRSSPPSIPAPARASEATTRKLPVRKPRPQHPARPGILLERLLPHQIFPANRAREAAVRRPILQRLQPSEFRTPQHWSWPASPESPPHNGLRRAHLHHRPSHGTARRRPRRRQHAPA